MQELAHVTDPDAPLKLRLPRWIHALRARPAAAGRWIEGQFEAGHPVPLAYHLYLPAERRRGRRPLLLMLHGCKQQAREFAAGTRMNRLADRERFLVLYPQQGVRANPLRCWNWFAGATLSGKGESAQIAGLVRDLVERNDVDPQRVYVAGMSAGAAMAQVLAVRHGELFAGCAVHSGLMFGAATSPMRAMQAMRGGAGAVPAKLIAEALRGREHHKRVPTVVIHGLQDRIVNPANAAQVVEQCCALAEYGVSPAQHIEIRERRWAAGERQCLQMDYTLGGAVVVRKIMIDGLAHAWSGGDATYAFNDPASPDSSAMIWEFFSLAARP